MVTYEGVTIIFTLGLDWVSASQVAHPFPKATHVIMLPAIPFKSPICTHSYLESFKVCKVLTIIQVSTFDINRLDN